jgi:PAS domain S-box-containing protein
MTDDQMPVHSEELPIQVIVEHLPVVVYVDTPWVPLPRTIYVSPNVKDVLGYPPEFYLGDNWLETVHADDLDALKEDLRRVAEQAVPYEQHYRYIHPDGHEISVRDRAVPYLDETTGQRRWIGIVEDITHRVEAEKALGMSALRLETLLSNLPAVVYEMDPDDDRRTRYVNRKIEDILGYTMEEWLDQPDMWMEVLHPDDRERELAAHDHASATGEAWGREYRVIAADGRIVWVRDQAALLPDLDGHPLQWQGVLIDITAEKEAQLKLAAAHEELEFRVRARTAQLQETNELMGVEIAERRRAEEERLRAETHLGYLLHNLPALVYVWQVRPSPDGTWTTYVGEYVNQMLGMSPEEWNDDGWRARIHPHDRAMVEDAVRRITETGEPFQLQYRYLAMDGRVVWVLDHATLSKRTADGEPLLFEGVLIDITSLKEDEHRAASADERFREVVERGPMVLYSFSIDQDEHVTIEYLGPQLEAMLGIAPNVWQEDPERWFAMVHPDDQDEVRRGSRETWRTGDPWEDEYRIIAADGSVKWIADRGTCVERYPSGKPLRLVGVISDVTERREQESANQRELDALAEHARHSAAVLWSETWDPVSGLSRYDYIRGDTEAVYGYTAPELETEGEHFWRLLHPDDVERVRANLGGKSGLWHDLFRIIHRDGSVRWMEGYGRRASAHGEVPERWHGVTVDVTPMYAESQADASDAPAEADPGRT